MTDENKTAPEAEPGKGKGKGKQAVNKRAAAQSGVNAGDAPAPGAGDPAALNIAPVTLESTADTAAVTTEQDSTQDSTKVTKPAGDEPTAAATQKADEPAEDTPPAVADTGILAVVARALKDAEAKGDHGQASKLAALETRLSELRVHLAHLDADDLAPEIGEIVAGIRDAL